MQCTSPIYLPGPLHGGGRVWREVACGSCTACRLQRTREWRLRCLHELESWRRASFVTWTYDPSTLPQGDFGGSLRQLVPSTLVKRDLQLGVKRLRKAVGRMRYYSCGEYGEKDGRPHYHGVVFGTEDVTRITEAWNLGFVHVGSVTGDSIGYVTDYVCKRLTGDQAREVYGRREPPFSLMSKGLGRDWCDEHADEFREDLGTTVNGVPVGLPRYYCKRLGISAHERELIELRWEQAAEVREYQAGAIADGESIEDGIARSRAQHARNIEARVALKERKL